MNLLNNYWFLLIMIIILETGSMGIMKYSLMDNNNLYIIGIIGYLLVGIVFYLILKRNIKLPVANTMWNVGTIVLISIYSKVFLKNKIEAYEYIGISLAILSIFVFNLGNKLP